MSDSGLASGLRVPDAPVIPLGRTSDALGIATPMQNSVQMPAPAPQAGAPSTPPPAAPPSPQQGADPGAVQQAVAQEWKAAGYSDAAVQGILQRIGVESSFNPHAIGDSGTSFGLYQHHAERAAALHQWARQHNADAGDPLVQTRFAIHEMAGGDPKAARARDALMRASDPNAAYGLFTASFERPAGTGGAGTSGTATSDPAAAMRNATFGPFTGAAQQMIQHEMERLRTADQRYDKAIASSDDLRGAAGAALRAWQNESNHPPQNMHQAWQQWSGLAGALALLGGVVGHSHTAAIAAAGSMLQAANSSDERAYEQSYKQWSDHLDRGMKLTDLLLKEAREVIEDGRKPITDIYNELNSLSVAYGLSEKLNPESVYNKLQQAQLAEANSKILRTNIENHAYQSALERNKAAGQSETEAATNAFNETIGAGNTPEARAFARAYQDTLTRHIAEGDPQAGLHAYQEAQQARYRAPRATSEAQYIQDIKDADKARLGHDLTPEENTEAERRGRREWAQEQAAGRVAAGKAMTPAAKSFVEDVTARTGAPPTYQDWVRFSQEQHGSQTGQLAPEAVEMLAKQYEAGDPGVITSLPRGGPARLQIENKVAEDLRDQPEGYRTVVMNRLRNAEAKAAATTAGRITMQTELFAHEAAAQGAQVVATSKLFSRTNYPSVNEALAAFERGTGDPNIIAFGNALNAFFNTYGKMSNPTGQGVHDSDKERITKLLDTSLSQGQIEAGVNQIIKEGEIISNAAREAQISVLAGLAPRAGAAPFAPPTASQPAGTAAQATSAPGAAPPAGGVIRYDANGNRIP